MSRADDIRAELARRQPQPSGRAAEIQAELSRRAELPSQGESALRGAAQGASLGFSDELAGLGGGVADMTKALFSGELDEASFVDFYRKHRDEARAANVAAQEANPLTYLGSEIAGGLVMPGGAGTQAVKGLSKGAKVLQGAKTGAGFGAAAGLGMSEQDSVMGDVVETAKGAALGSVVGGAIPAVAGAIRGGSKGVVDMAQAFDPSKGIIKGVTGYQLPGTLAKKAQIQAGDMSEDLAGSKILPSGKLVADDAAQEALNQGFRGDVIQPLKSLGSRGKHLARKMVNVAEKSQKDARFALDNRPSDIVGDEMMDRVNEVRKINKRAGVSVNKEAAKLKGKFVDALPVATKFQSSLEDLGAKVVPDIKTDKAGNVISEGLKIDFSGSTIKNIAPAKRAINNVFNDMIGKTPDAHDIHKLKLAIDEEVMFGKNVKGLAGKGERVLKTLRHDLNALLQDNFEGYAKANKEYSDTIGALDTFQGVFGKKNDFDATGAGRHVGQKLRGLMSNNATRNQLNNAIADVDEVLSLHRGGDRLRLPGAVDTVAKKEDLKTLVLFADELDNVFEVSGRTTFKNQITEGVKAAAGVRTISKIAEKLATGKPKTKNQLKAIRNLLRPE